ncbi:tyrosine-type recombinase/integrase [Solobacterium moorei]|uniref:tyrosine-type recombinase/integrase n=1 Tax=Solobacterium moorei TaxID=102148 RepID=UPI0024ADF482|nr:tyrosine-type recombinase/integrase [Solobacterium moorei]MDI6414771.1 tyrosine-type recombinase/integrase [Solobacterium moorei]
MVTREEINIIIQKMSVYLDNVQMIKLQEILAGVSDNTDIEDVKSSEELLELFIAVKRLEGRSELTLGLYKHNIEKLLASVDKNVCLLNTDDIRAFLSDYRREKGISKVTLDNMRRNLLCFYNWLEDKSYIFQNPLRRIHKIKAPIQVKETYSDEELEKMRDACKNTRDLAIVDFLNSTGVRVSELVNLDISDIDFEERECVVLGKGDNSALWVSNKVPYERIHASGVERMLRKLGKRCGIAKVYPHKFRRTMATVAIDTGMAIEQVQQLLGHEKIDTTLRYVQVKQNNVKMSHKKYFG